MSLSVKKPNRRLAGNITNFLKKELTSAENATFRFLNQKANLRLVAAGQALTTQFRAQ